MASQYFDFVRDREETPHERIERLLDCLCDDQRLRPDRTEPSRYTRRYSTPTNLAEIVTACWQQMLQQGPRREQIYELCDAAFPVTRFEAGLAGADSNT